MLDASKLFDRVKYVTLFILLCKNSTLPCCLAPHNEYVCESMYTNQKELHDL